MGGNSTDTVQTFGRKKTAVAVAFAKAGTGRYRVNGMDIDLINPPSLRLKIYEVGMLLGKNEDGTDKKDMLDVKVRVRGGGYTSQIYAIRQSIAKAFVAYFQKYVDEASKKEIKDTFMNYDRSLIVADLRRCEPKKFGGPGARARYQKSYR